ETRHPVEGVGPMRTIASLVLATFVTALLATGNSLRAHAQPGGDPEIAIDPEPRIAYAYGPNLRFGVSVLKDQAGKPAKELLTFAADGRTNTTVVKIDGKAQEFGGSTGKWIEKMTQVAAEASGKARDISKSTWEAGKLRFTQIVQIVASKQPVEVAPGVSK